MMKLIDGNWYDTGTARYCGGSTWNYGYRRELYCTPTGNYFLVVQSQWDGERDRIIPMTTEAAMYQYAYLDGPRAQDAFQVAQK